MATFDEPQSRIEAILQNMLGANNELLPPMSRNEALLLELLRQGSVTEEEIAKKLAAPVNASGEPVYGTSGQILQTNGDGTTQWTDGGGGGSTLVCNITFDESGEVATLDKTYNQLKAALNAGQVIMAVQNGISTIVRMLESLGMNLDGSYGARFATGGDFIGFTAQSADSYMTGVID